MTARRFLIPFLMGCMALQPLPAQYAVSKVMTFSAGELGIPKASEPAAPSVAERTVPSIEEPSIEETAIEKLTAEEIDELAVDGLVDDEFTVEELTTEESAVDEPAVPVIQAAVLGVSDVDIDIPVTSVINDHTIALIIANENYMFAADVENAIHDGEVFTQYCEKTLGIPTEQVNFCKNVTYAMLKGYVQYLRELAESFHGDVNIIFYYAGHGVPDESSHDAFLLPVDANGSMTSICYSLGDLYHELGSIDAKSVVVLLDACFSGARRDGNMLLAARSVAISYNPTDPCGNMITFCAAQGDETAYPYIEQGHGMFTYYLLKKLQETAGNVTMSDLTDYVTENVNRRSLIVNKKRQTPVLDYSISMEESWRDFKFIR